MILHDFECTNGHLFEKAVKSGQTRAKCLHKRCKKMATVTFLPRNRRAWSEPIVIYKCADGQFSFPGRTDARPPRDAVERIECRNRQEYDRAMKRVNDYYGTKAARVAEKTELANTAWREQFRSRLRDRLANEQDNFARDLLREALAASPSDYEPKRFTPIVSEAMEYDASNRDGEYRRGGRERK